MSSRGSPRVYGPRQPVACKACYHPLEVDGSCKSKGCLIVRARRAS